MMRATRLGERYIARIKRGERVPDPKHWPAFRNAVADRTSE
jgi:hypothetical protein